MSGQGRVDGPLGMQQGREGKKLWEKVGEREYRQFAECLSGGNSKSNIEAKTG